MRQWNITAKDEMKKLLFIFAATLCLVACEKNAEISSPTEDGYVDLGLPSGTKWKNVNEHNPQDQSGFGFYTFQEAYSAFGNSIPTKAQCEELINKCTWKWTGNGCKVVGTNGNFITFPANGFRDSKDGGVWYNTLRGCYWTTTRSPSPENYWTMDFGSGGQIISDQGYRNTGHSVRLVR